MKKFFSLVAVALLGTSLWAKTDVTNTYLTNADLSSLDGWTLDKVDGWTTGYTAHNTSTGGLNVIEFYNEWGADAGTTITTGSKTFNFSQKPTLPAGYYRLQVNGFYREGNNNPTTGQQKAYIFAGSKQQYLTGYQGTSGTGKEIAQAGQMFAAGSYSNEFDFKVEKDTALEIGFHGYIDTYCSWCIMGPVHLYEYTAADYMEAVQARNTVAKALVDPMDSTINATLQKAIAVVDSLKETNSVDDVLVAQDALNSAITAANTSIAEYKTLKAVFDKAAALDESASAYFTTAAGAVIASYNNGGYTSSAIAAALASAQETYLAAVKMQTTAGADMTGIMPSAWTNATGSYGDCAERYNNDVPYEPGKILYQTVTGLHKGVYEVQFIAIANVARNLNVATYAGDSIAQVYANDSVLDIKVINQDNCTTTDAAYLRTMTVTLSEDGDLEYGIKNIKAGGQWYVAKAVKLTYVSAGTVNVESVALGEDFEMTVGDEPKTIEASVLPADATNKSLTWKSSADSVATVADGVVTAVSEGEAYIIATSNNNITDTVKVTVKAAPVEEEEEIGEKNLHEYYDFSAFVAGGAPTLTIGTDTILQEGTNALPVFLINDPTNTTAGETLKLKNRFALNCNSSAALTLRWMWRSDASNGYKNGLAGNWNSKGTSIASFNISVLSLYKGDTLTLNYSMQSGKAAQFHTCSAGVLATADGQALAAGDQVLSGVKYVVLKSGNVDLYNTNNNVAINSVDIITELEKIPATDTFDFSAFVAGGAPTLTIGTDTILQEGTNALPVFLINDPTNTTAGETLKLKNRFALNCNSSAALTLRWMWRSDASNGYKNGLAGNWNSKGTSIASFNISVLNLVKGDSIVINYSMQSGKAAQFHTCSAGIIATAEGEVLDAEAIMVSGTKYVVKKTGRLDLYNTNNNVAINSVVINYKTTSLPAPTIASAGDASGAVKVSVENADGDVFYSIDGGEAQSYAKPFYLTQTANVSAWYESNGIVSTTADARIKAGEIATPTVTAIAARDGERTVAIGTTTAGAYLLVNGDTVKSNVDTLTISATATFEVFANTETVTADSTYVLSSATASQTIEAGSTIQLNAVTVVKVSDADSKWVFVANNSSSDIIGQPQTNISYVVYPTNETDTVAPGDTLTFPTHERITLYANAEGYATSEGTVVWTREPAQLELVWADDFKANAEATLTSASYTAVLQSNTFTAGNYTLCPVQVSDDYISNENFGVESGTNWLQRNVNGYVGLYNYNSGQRRFGINNLVKTQVVKLTVQDPSTIALLNDVLQLDETNSTANTLYYNCVKDGAAVLGMTRYYCIWGVEVYNNPDVTASPNIYIAGKEDDARKVTVIPAEVAYPANQFTYYSVANGTKVDSTLVAEATDSTAAVYSYDTVAVYTDFAPVEGQFSVNKPNNTVVAYTEYEGKASEQTTVTIDCDSIYSLILPTISWVEKVGGTFIDSTLIKAATDSTVAEYRYDTTTVADAHVFAIKNTNLIQQGLYPELNVTYNDSKSTLSGADNELIIEGSGWLKVQAVLPGMDTAYVVSRYVAENRESYNENYDAIIDGDTLTAGSYAGDVEFEAGAAVSGEYPTKNISVGGTQFFHKAVNSYYSTFTLPFAFSAGKNVVTDAKGNELVAGEDYEIATLTNLKNGNVVSSTDASTLINEGNADACVRTSALAAGTPVMFHALSEKVGSEVIISSVAKAAVTYAAASTAMPTSGYKVYGNKRYQAVALDTAAYVLNAKGTQLVYTNKPTVAPMQVAVLADSATVAALGKTIVLVDMSYKYTALELTKDTLIWLNQADLVAANEAGWAATDNEDDYASFKTTSKSYTIDPTNDAEVTATKYTGIIAKNNQDKYINLYVSGVDSLVVYGLSSKSGESRAVKVESIPVAGDATSASLASTGNTVMVSLKPSTTGEQKIRISGPDGDVMVYAIKFIYGEPTGIQNVAADMEIDAIYDLQGRKANELKAGEIYIINGRRYMVK